MKIIINAYGVTLLRKITLIIALLAGNVLLAQDFELTVSPTNETCPGNGSLQFSVQNAGASVNYKVYLLPNTTTPISNNSYSSVSGLGDGTYLVVATTIVNGNTVTDQQEATIADNTTPMIFADEWQTTPSFCDDGIITVVMESGLPIAYQITAGPETAPTQASATFTGLPEGVYTIKATDACGTAVVTTYTLGSIAAELIVGMGGYAPQLPDCEHITVVGDASNINPDADIVYPLTTQITVYPPDGSSPQVFNGSVYGFPDTAMIMQTIPLYYGQEYFYDLLLTDTCGTEYEVNNTSIMPVFGFSASTIDLQCGKALKLTPSVYVPPITLNFTSAPEGFDPTIVESYPQIYGEAVFGDDDHPLIEGQYYYTATDACGRTISGMYEYIAPPPIIPEASPTNTDCENNLGKIQNGVIPSRDITIAIITDAPQEFIDLYGPLPLDVSNYILVYPNDDDVLNIPGTPPTGNIAGLPPGDYVLVFTDDCGIEYDPLTVTVPQYTSSQKTPRGRPDCEVGMATVCIGADIVAVTITAVPAGSPYTVPFDGNAYINAGSFSLDNLIPGTYTFEISDECQTYTKTINLVGYDTTVNQISMTPYCGSFDISLFHTTTGVAGLAFWLQREISPGVWGHPATGVSLTDTYNTNTAVQLTNNTVNTTLIYPQGNYRIVKTFRAFESGDIATDKTCVEPLFDFEYIDGVDILGVQSLTCTGVSGDIQVNAVGVDPLTYTIVAKNGDPYTVANGNNSSFYGLDSAYYTIEVGDPCGNTSVLSFNIAEVPSLVNAYPAPNMVLCDIGSDGVEEFVLSDQDTYILNGQDTTNITLTYHPSYNDADAGINPLPLSYTTGPTTVYARAEYNGAVTCHDITVFDLILNYSAEMNMQDMYYVCDGTEQELIADPGYVSYLWSTGAQTQSITVTQEGQYSVTAISSQGCISQKTVDVYTTALPTISNITVQDWTETDNSIIIEVGTSNASVQNFEYSINGIFWQDSNIFTGLEPGSYTVYVRDIYGCDWVSETVYLLTYPRFFTPNGDGINETWRIKYASLAEPDLMVYIYDRYGKLITGFDAHSIGWDGTLNSANLPATDYWFVVKRQNGKEYRGHFSLLR
jgi:gliding motility-associated-like protein